MLYAPLPMLVFDVATGEILWCNDMFTDLTGLKDKIFETAVDAVIPRLHLPLAAGRQA